MILLVTPGQIGCPTFSASSTLLDFARKATSASRISWACVGSTRCRMAVTDTPTTSRLLLAELGEDRAFWEDVGPLRINMNGCPNNCTHAWIADIGLRGKRRRGEGGRNVEGFSIFLGGKLSEGGHIGEHLLDVDTPALPGVIRSLLGHYLRERHDKSETFCRYVVLFGGYDVS